MSKLVLERTANGATVLEILTCYPGAEGIAAHQRLKNEAGGAAGKPIWVWNTIPNSSQVVGMTTAGAINCQATAAQTQILIDAFKANPTAQPDGPDGVLIYAE
ncbi:hypothetical protein [Neorhizobium galegae]|uniref:hypothetical protein n=1 Tax=Neorhizobium galegae TaxID=399 RepID=UPI0012D41471|nr:hypothetical protein [Neorhizobium galegae]